MKTRGFHGRVPALSALTVLLSLTFATPARAELEFLTQWGAPAGGELVAPVDVERDDAGNTYVVDVFTATVQKFDAANNFALSWGGHGSSPGRFGFPSAIGVDEASGQVYVADIASDQPDAGIRIQRFDSSGNLLGEFGSFGTAEGQFSAAVSGIAVHSPTGDVYVTEGHRVQRFSATGAFELMWGKDVNAVNPGTGAEICQVSCKEGEQGSKEGELTHPTDIAANAFGVFVTEDTNKRVQRFDLDGGFQIMGGRDVTPGGSVTGETCTVNCQAGIGGTGPGELNEPRGIDVNDSFGVVYIVDQANDRVQQWNAALTYLGETGTEGSGDGQFMVPDGLAESSAAPGNLVVADASLHRVQRFNGLNFHSRFGEPAQATLVVPQGIGTGTGGVYVTDGLDRVIQFDSGGGFVGSFGSQGAAPGQFVRPAGLAGDLAGNVYVADEGNNRIQRFDAAGATLGAWGSFGGATGEFDAPQDVAAGPGGNVYVLDDGGNSRVQKFSPIGAFLGTWGAPGDAPGQFGGAQGIATDSDGNVYVADTGNDRIQKFDANGTLLAAWGSTGTGNGQFDSPTDLAVDRLGNVFVADRDNNRVQRFDNNGNFTGRWGANGGDGTAGDGPGEFFDPVSIAVDAAGDIYVLESFNGRVQKFARADAPLLVPELSMYGNRRQNARRLRVIVTCGGPPCTLRLFGRVLARGGGGRREADRAGGRRRGISLALKRTTVTLDEGESKTVKLKLKQRKRGLRRVTRALKRGARGTALVRGVASNDAGSDKAKRRLKLKSPGG